MSNKSAKKLRKIVNKKIIALVGIIKSFPLRKRIIIALDIIKGK